MPELPEVEIIKNYLLNTIINKKIIKTHKTRPNLRYLIPTNLEEVTREQQIINVRRRAKFLLIDLSNNYSILIHLGMSGKILLQNTNIKIAKHDHIIISLNNQKYLIFNDSRRFGMIDLVKSNQLESYLWLANIGPEPLLSEFNNQYLYTILKNKKSSIKNAIMNSSVVAGIGNIYANECLFCAKINPYRACNSLSHYQISNLVNSIKEILPQAIKLGGSSFQSFVNALGQKGNFQNKFLVYNRTKQPCVVCSNEISKRKQSGRSTFMCTVCQV
ncbi:formamidopyrimidine-DNA glycosylase [Orientia chuto str. Dubai]|uniref:Formamidopyrimidine-DNA glycosylase n=1 Tax=Orientia chuto str. Dubai TaxID=1359168 RepID=A0A0F3MJE0_9RICK|nr:bifunctional DNA-formamidopyrimidine glycosylase/DNA-(apurinic or apyrimidinic site) lyase [Candidatus Orientia mediorientalis]KJV55870.1 formamidopyrimidine-DNA glycosylase [Orientia chuto str. Dubai]